MMSGHHGNMGNHGYSSDSTHGEIPYNKQLPLRQKKDKPILKYSSSGGPSASTYANKNASTTVASKNLAGRPPAVPLFSQSDIQYLQQQLAAYCAPYNSTRTDGRYMGSFAKKYETPLQYALPFQKTSGTVNSQATQDNATVKLGSRNPYARPLSAKDIQPLEPSISYHGMNTEKAVKNSTAIRSSSNSSISSNGSSNSHQASSGLSGLTGTVIQTNSFMRPQSAFKVDKNIASPEDVKDNVGGVAQLVSNTSISAKHMGENGLVPRPPLVARQIQNTTDDTMNSLQTGVKPTTMGSPGLGLEGLAGMVISKSSGEVVNNTKVAVIRQNSCPGDGAVKKRTPNCTERNGAARLVASASVNGNNCVIRQNTKVKNAEIDITNEMKGPSTDKSHSSGSSNKHVTVTNDVSNHSNVVPSSRKSHNIVPNSATSMYTSKKSVQFCSSVNNEKPNRESSECVSKSGIPRPGMNHNARPDMGGGYLSGVAAKGVASRTVSQVRNLNYTPNKPYNQVRHTDQPDVVSVYAKQKSPNPPMTGSVVKDPLFLSSCGESRRQEAQSSRESTKYYHKSSRTEEVLQDPKGKIKPEEPVGEATHVTIITQGGPDPEEDDGEWTDEAEDDDPEDATDSNGERLPGDGEDSVDQVDEDDEDDMIDAIEDDCDDDEDGNTDLFSRASSTNVSRNGSAVHVHSATKRLLGLSIKDRASSAVRPSKSQASTTTRGRPVSAVSTLSANSDLQPALTASLFPNVPPTINFVRDGEKVEQLPWEIRKLFKWRMSPITPNVVKNCIARSHFRPTKKNHDWIGYWGKHMKAPGFKAIREYQKVNHFPGSFQIGRKDRLWRNLSRMQVHYGKKEFSFFPQTYVLPFDLKLLKRAWEEGGNKQKWIIKPPASARGIGIKVIHKWNQIPRKRPVIVQRYLSRPYLINDSKFDLRIYVYVTSYDPLRIYIYDDGLVRFASCKYSYAMKNLNNKYMHLTNYSINKKNQQYENNQDETICQGHKWGLKALWGYMKKRGIDTSRVWDNIKDLVIKTIICSESCVNSLMKTSVRSRYSCHELFGFDVMLDENLKPWIIEVNISPSLHSNSPLDINIKGGMVRDLLNISGFQIPDKRDVVASPAALSDSSKYVVTRDVCMDKRLRPTQMSPDERAKHAYYCQRHNDEAVQATILDILTPDDIRMLVEILDEDSRKGNYERVFPTISSCKYHRFFEARRYYNLLQDAWLQRYHRMEARGIAYLESLCEKGILLDNPTINPQHQWSPPSASSLREPRIISASSLPPSRPVSNAALPKLKKSTKTSSQCSSTTSLNSAGRNNSRPSTHRSFRRIEGIDGPQRVTSPAD